MTIDRSRFSNRRPTLDPDDIPGDKAVLTIGSVEEVELNDRNALVLEFKEFPGRAHWLNATQIDALIEQLGNEETAWVGKRIPVEKVKVKNPRTNEKVIKVYVCDPDDWEDVLKAARAKR